MIERNLRLKLSSFHKLVSSKYLFNTTAAIYSFFSAMINFSVVFFPFMSNKLFLEGVYRKEGYGGIIELAEKIMQVSVT